MAICSRHFTKESSESSETLLDRQLTESRREEKKQKQHHWHYFPDTDDRHRLATSGTRTHRFERRLERLMWRRKWQEMNCIKAFVLRTFIFPHHLPANRNASQALRHTCQFSWSMFAIIASVNSRHYFSPDVPLGAIDIIDLKITIWLQFELVFFLFFFFLRAHP